MSLALAITLFLSTSQLESAPADAVEPVHIDEPSARLFPQPTGPWFVGINAVYGAWATATLGHILQLPLPATIALGVGGAAFTGLIGFVTQRHFPLSPAATVAAFFVGFGGFMLGASGAYLLPLSQGSTTFDVALALGGLVGAPLLLLGWAAIPDTPTLGWLAAFAPFAVSGVAALLTVAVAESIARDARLRQPTTTLIVLIPSLAFVGTRLAVWASTASPSVVLIQDGQRGLAVGPSVIGTF